MVVSASRLSEVAGGRTADREATSPPLFVPPFIRSSVRRWSFSLFVRSYLWLTWVGPPAAGPRRSTRSCRRAACLRPGFPMLPDFQRVPTVSDPTCGFTPCSHTLPPSVYILTEIPIRGSGVLGGAVAQTASGGALSALCLARSASLLKIR